MKAEKIFKDSGGDRYKVAVVLELNGYSHSLSTYEWLIDVAKCPKGKRKFQPLYGRYTDRELQSLNREQKRSVIAKIILDSIPKEWVLEVQEIILDELRRPCI